MNGLGVDEFEAFFQAVHGYPPFPWQSRLLRQVVGDGQWPGTLKLPTASGKTSVMDVALFALALEASKAPSERRMARRIVLVVDRRIVVDGAFERATHIREALEKTDSAEVVRNVAQALITLSGEGNGPGVPLVTSLLRGGMYREDRWARTPTQPAILCSTVDQVGSRLLHRGYGLSPRTWPIHAGLLAEDSLIVLDEAHCSVPFLETLGWVDRYRQTAEASVRRPRFVVSMTATPPESSGTIFELATEDRSHPVLRPRLEAHKPITLQPVPEKGEAKLVAALLEAISAKVRPGLTVLVTVNRVSTARAALAAVQKAAKGRKPTVDAEAILLTGRSRPVVRDELLKAHRDRLMAGRDREASKEARCLVVVATQCVEVGADLDVDALITEACPLDSLRQRLGRLDRLGQRHAAGESSPCVVLLPKEQEWSGNGEPPEDAIYGTSVAHTWEWLFRANDKAPLDGAADAFGRMCESSPTETRTQANHAPLMFPAYCDLWVQTGPEPAQSPEPALFLHGPNTEEPDVQVVWRADLERTAPEVWIDTVSLCPPVAGEAVPVRISAFRRWMSGESPDKSDGDIEGQHAADAKQLDGAPKWQVLRWLGERESEVVVDVSEVRPGDTLVLPSVAGGCDEYGWDPDHEGQVVDIAALARDKNRRAPVIRIHPLMFPADNSGTAETPAEELTAAKGPVEFRKFQNCKPLELKRLAGLAHDEPPDDLHAQICAALGEQWAAKDVRIEEHPSGKGWVVILNALLAEEGLDFTDEDDTSLLAREPLKLDVHSQDVGGFAGRFAEALGLAPALCEDLRLAGQLHDAGKADPRFQAWLAGGNRVMGLKGGLLAKSRNLGMGHAAREKARAASGYPKGARHELLSVRLAESAAGLLGRAHDRDLVLHLVASHHGHCRPFAPVVVDEKPLEVSWAWEGVAMKASSATGLESLTSGVAERFWRLVHKYGWWGLSYLEACLRLADHRASEAREKGRQP